VDQIIDIKSNPETDYGYKAITAALVLLGYVINHKKVYRLIFEFHLLQEARKCNRRNSLKSRPIRYADGWNTGPAWETADVHDIMYYDGGQNKLAI